MEDDDLIDMSPAEELDELIEHDAVTNTEQEADQAPATREPRVMISAALSIEGATPDRAPVLALPSMPFEDYLHFLMRLGDVTEADRAGYLKHWSDLVEKTVANYTTAQMYQQRLNDPESLFTQGIPRPDGTLASIAPVRFKSSTGEVKGAMAVMKITRQLGAGEVVHVPLPTTGIWVTITPPSELDTIDFYNNLFRIKSMFGRATNGLFHSNFAIIAKKAIYDFIYNHIYTHTVKGVSKEALKTIIKAPDLQILTLGFLDAMYPNGYNYSRICTSHGINAPDKDRTCHHISTEVAALAKMLVIDQSRLTPFQLEVMQRMAPGSTTIEELERYQNEHRVRERKVTTAQGIVLSIEQPSIEDNLTDGLAWVNRVNAAVEATLLSEEDIQGRSKALSEQVQASALRQYAHFVRRIDVEGSFVVDRQTINEALERLSSNDEARAQIIEAINQFENDSTIAIVAVPEYKCPACDHIQNPTKEGFTNAVPIDVLNLFFTLVTSKISVVLNREV